MKKYRHELLSLAENTITEIQSLKNCIQFCGPISTGGFGNVRDNIDCLQSFINEAKILGFSVFDQLSLEKTLDKILGPTKEYDHDLLDFFYKPILDSGYIKTLVFIPEWQSSFGSQWEMNMGIKNNIEIIILEDNTLRTLISRKK